MKTGNDYFSSLLILQYLTKYWNDIGERPEWQKKMNIGVRYVEEEISI